MTKSHFTEQQKKEIYEMYCDKTIKIADIATAYKTDPSTVSKLARKLGAPYRSPTRGIRHTKDIAKVCPKCKKHIKIKDAIFCPYCGTDIRGPKELLIGRVNSAMPKLKFVPVIEVRDELQKLLIDIKQELSKGD